MLAAAAWDGWHRRWTLATAVLIGALPALAWMAYAANYLFSDRAGSWIGAPDYALLEETLPVRPRPLAVAQIGPDSAVAAGAAALGRAAPFAVAADGSA